jgi:hypothetical protein
VGVRQKGNRQADMGPCRGCAGPGEGALTTTLQGKRYTALIGFANGMGEFATVAGQW